MTRKLLFYSLCTIVLQEVEKKNKWIDINAIRGYKLNFMSSIFIRLRLSEAINFWLIQEYLASLK